MAISIAFAYGNNSDRIAEVPAGRAAFTAVMPAGERATVGIGLRLSQPLALAPEDATHGVAGEPSERCVRNSLIPCNRPAASAIHAHLPATSSLRTHPICISTTTTPRVSTAATAPAGRPAVCG